MTEAGAPAAALVAATSAELLGERPLPKVLRARPLLFVFGPPGSGKSVVARRICGADALELDPAALSRAGAAAVRDRRWPAAVDAAAALVIDSPTGLAGRPGLVRALTELLARRALAGQRTVIIEGAVAHSVLPLMEALPPALRCTLVLRFPEGRGRRRFALQVCAERGLPPALARGCAELQPWSYSAVIALLERAHPSP